MKEENNFNIWEYYKDWFQTLPESQYDKNPPMPFNDYINRKKEETNDN